MIACPGCGKTDKLVITIRYITYWNKNMRHAVKCKCGWSGPEGKTEEEAIKLWDKRYGDTK